MDERNPEALLPLTPAVFHILLALAGGELHGYAIMQDVALRSGGRITLGPGLLYGSIKRMVADGLIVESETRPDPALDDQRRRYYRMTEWGRQIGAAEARRLEHLVQQARDERLLPVGEQIG